MEKVGSQSHDGTHHFTTSDTLWSSYPALASFPCYSMAISIQKMIRRTHVGVENSSIPEVEHPGSGVSYNEDDVFDWDNEIVSIILSWYMLTFNLFQVASTRLSIKLGLRWSLCIAMLICGASQLLTPLAARWGWRWVVATRLLNGLGAAPVPAIGLDLMEIWMRHDEVSLSLNLSFAYVSSLMMLSPLFMGYLAQISWLYAFYLPGLWAVIFSAIWFVLAADRPEESFFISDKELEHIRQGRDINSACERMEQVEAAKSEVVDAQSKDSSEQPRSWLEIFKVPQLYSYVLVWILFQCSNHAYIFIVFTYLGQFLKIGVAENGFYGFLIDSGNLLNIIWPYLSERLLLARGLTQHKARMVQQTLICAAVFGSWLWVGLFHSHQILALFINRSFFTANQIVLPASLMSSFGRARLSSVAFAIANSCAGFLIVPISTSIGWLLDFSGQSRECWTWIFVGLASSHLFLWLAYVLLIDLKPIEFNGKRASTNSRASRLQA